MGAASSSFPPVFLFTRPKPPPQRPKRPVERETRVEPPKDTGIPVLHTCVKCRTAFNIIHQHCPNCACKVE